MNLQISHSWVLLLMPLALLPFFRSDRKILSYGWLELIPRDLVSGLVGFALRLIAAATIAAMILGLSGLYRSEVTEERSGRGAQIVVLLDRSRSMDESFNQGRVNHDPRENLTLAQQQEIKGKVARSLLAKFAAQRPNDLFGMVLFSSYPLPVLDFTQKQEAIQAAIRAGDIGKGLSETDLARGLFSALTYFENKPYTGSRIVLLVSDGGARIDAGTRQKLSQVIKRNRVGLYWIYLRSVHSVSLFADRNQAQADPELTPETALHQYFTSLGIPYRAYEADSSDALERAIQDVNRLENLPMVINEIIPRRELAPICYWIAALLMMLLLASKLMEVRSWR